MKTRIDRTLDPVDLGVTLPWPLRLAAMPIAATIALVWLAAIAASGALTGMPLLSATVLLTVVPTLAVTLTRLSAELTLAPPGNYQLGLRTSLLVFWQLRVLGQLVSHGWAEPLLATAAFALTLSVRRPGLSFWIGAVLALECLHRLLFRADGLGTWVELAIWLPAPILLGMALRRRTDKAEPQRTAAAASAGEGHWNDGQWTRWALCQLTPQTPATTLSDLHTLLRLTLEQLRRAVEASTTLIFVVDREGGLLHLAEYSGQGDGLREGPYPVGQGVLSAIIQSKSLTALTDIRPGFGGLSYRTESESDATLVRHFVGLPIANPDGVVAILCMEREQPLPFTGRDLDLLERAGTTLHCALRSERVFVDLEFSKREQRILYEASRALAEARDVEDAVRVALDAAAQVTPFDVALVTQVVKADATPEASMALGGASGDSGPGDLRPSGFVRRKPRLAQTVLYAVGVPADSLVGTTFSDLNALAQLAVTKRHALPYRGLFDGAHQQALGEGDKLDDLRSLLITPLVARDDVLGTLMLGSREAGLYQGTTVPTLQVLSNQLAVSLANLEAVRRLAQLATTDGLTGCLNKRAFLDELSKRLRSAERFGAPLSLLVTDIDHFKNVNDTFGHATGDRVIRRLGHLLQQMKRDTDIVARFGGEEFCVLCEHTDAAGALLLAERVREHLEACVFATEKGELRVTCSLGVATFPECGKEPASLFEAADKALYVAKHDGRNRVRSAS